VPSLRMSEALPQIFLYVFMTWCIDTGTELFLPIHWHDYIRFQFIMLAISSVDMIGIPYM